MPQIPDHPFACNRCLSSDDAAAVREEEETDD